MSLRRTALTRRSELRRTTPMPRAKRELARRTERTIRRQRQTGPTTAVRQVVAERADWACEICGRPLGTLEGWLSAHSVHHRQPRGAGGTSALEVNAPSNLMLLCGSGTTGCHGYLESHRADAYELGWLVRSGFTPGVVPVSIAGRDQRVYLTADGHYLEVS